MKVAVYSRGIEDNHLKQVEEIFRLFDEAGIKCIIHQNLLHSLQGKMNLQSEPLIFTGGEDLPVDASFLLSFGGDGTFLESTLLVNGKNIPVMGINTGRLGFLSSTSIDEASLAVKTMLENKCKIDTRIMLKLETEKGYFGKRNFALNEITVQKKDSSSMITIHTYVDDTFVNSYWADGLIVSTPTGSTAYSLSCGGPIVLPKSGNFVLTPVAPHNLSTRPLVIPDSCTVKLIVEGRNDNFLVSLDSQSDSVSYKDELIIKRNDFDVNILRLPDYSYAQTIRTKLNWGLDKRNRA